MSEILELAKCIQLSFVLNFLTKEFKNLAHYQIIYIDLHSH
jgi:hypothetical protein